MASELATGWDLGGAHLKVAQADAAGRLGVALQVPCALWRGLDRLAAAIAQVRPQLAATKRHGITMTGELVDLFQDRADGVRQLTQFMCDAFTDADLRIYAGPAGFTRPEAASAQAQSVASANWHASVRFVARRLAAGLFLDIGSTTTDVVPFCDGSVLAAGFTDAERMAAEELVYTGVTRTPVMALGDRIAFAGERQGLMAEYFATAADVHRLTGALPEDADQHETADGRGKTAEDSARRLARMLGRDFVADDLPAWRRLAMQLAERQIRLVHDAIDRTLSRGVLPDEAPLVGAGVGRFMARELAPRLKRPYVDFTELVSGQAEAREWAARCAPAAAVAVLAAAERG